MHPYAVISLFNALAVIILGFFVFVKNPRGRVHRDWLLLSLAAGGWSFSTFLLNISRMPEVALVWVRVLNYFAIFIGPLFIKFSYSAVQKELKKAQLLFLITTACLLLILAVRFPRTFIYAVQPGDFFYFNPRIDGLYHFYAAFLLSCVGYSLFFLYREFKIAGQQRKNQLKYLFLSMFIAFTGGTSTLLICYGVEFPYGNFYFSLYAFIMSYAIVTHRLMDIEVVIKRTLVFAGLSSFVIACFSIPLFLLSRFLSKSETLQLCLLMVAGMVVAAVVSPLNQFLIHITDQYLFQKKFDYRKVLKYASEGLSHVNSLKHQLKLVTHFLTSRARIKSTAIYMPENDEGHGFILMEHRSFDGIAAFPERLPFDSQVLIYLKKERRKPFLEFYNIEDEARKYKQNASTFQYDLNGLRDEIRKLNAHLIIPSFYQDELQGILVLGEKRSEESYHEEDIHLFQTIAQESAIAFENARKHDELVEQKEKLARVNEELRRTQEEVIQAKEAAAVAALSAGISHEIGNNILGLTGAIQEIKETFDRVLRLMNQWHHSGEPVGDSEKYELFMLLKSGREALGHARKTSLHIEDVVTTLSQIAKGKYARMVRISLRVFLKNAVNASMLRTYGDRVKSQALEKPPELEMDKDLPPIKGHTELLNAVFINLFKNAIHAMNGVSPKKIKIRALRDPEEHDMVRIEFSDNGSGIPPEVLPRIFDYGFTTKRAEGEGKGLFNVKTIIEREHKGAIGVQSESGKGTTFIIKIPAYQEEDEDYSDPAASGA